MEQNRARVAIITPQVDCVSETFIASHIKEIRGVQLVYHGGEVPTLISGEAIAGLTTVSVMARKALALLLKPSNWTIAHYLFYQSVKKNKPHVALVEYGTTALAIVDCLQKAKVDFIVHFHGYDASVYDIVAQLKSDRGQTLFKICSGIVVVSEQMREQLIAVGCPAQKIILNPCGAPDRGEKNQNEKEKCTFLSVGRFVDKKAPYYTLLAFDIALKSGIKAEMHFIGDGPLLQACIHLAKFLGISDFITFYGSRDNDFVSEGMKKSDVFTQHSITALNGDQEGSPVSIMEASMTGLPVISTRHMGITQTVVHGKTGFLVDEHDVNQMAKYMIVLAEDAKLRRNLGYNGRQLMLKSFTRLQHIRTLEALIDKIYKKQSN